MSSGVRFRGRRRTRYRRRSRRHRHYRRHLSEAFFSYLESEEKLRQKKPEKRAKKGHKFSRVTRDKQQQLLLRHFIDTNS